MTLQDRVDAFKAAYPDTPDAWPYVSPSGRWIYGTWEQGNNFKSETGYLGSYPIGYLDRVMALFPDVDGPQILHAFSGSVPPGPYVRLDCNPFLFPDVLGNVYDAATLFPARRFRLDVCDPPYDERYAARYNVAQVDRTRALEALADVTEPGGFCVWLDIMPPLISKSIWNNVGKIAYYTSSNHWMRGVFLFERGAA